MSKAKAADWQNRNIADWNATTFFAYLADQHEERFGIAYVARNYAMEGRMIRDLYGKYGKPATKAFIDACMAEYSPSAQYPGVNFAFMYSYMRDRVLPRVLAAEVHEQQAVEDTEGLAEAAKWL